MEGLAPTATNDLCMLVSLGIGTLYMTHKVLTCEGQPVGLQILHDIDADAKLPSQRHDVARRSLERNDSGEDLLIWTCSRYVSKPRGEDEHRANAYRLVKALKLKKMKLSTTGE
jgi:hypothetical protein